MSPRFEPITGRYLNFDLLVAARAGEYSPPGHLRDSITSLDLGCSLDHVSASEVRARMLRGEPWEHLVPPGAQQRVREIYA